MKRWKTRNLVCVVLTGCLVAVFGTGIFAAQPEHPRTGQSGNESGSDGVRKKLTPEEQSAIDRAGGGNDRVKVYVRLAETRLRNTREALSREDYKTADENLEAYVVLISDAGQFTKNSVPQRDKAHKTLEQALRAQLRLLEGIRRDTLAEHAEPAERALATANRVRTQSLNLLLGGGTFLADPENETPKKSPEEKSGERAAKKQK